MAENETPESLPPPKLVVPRAEAAEKIEEQISKGQRINGRYLYVGYEEDKWIDFKTDFSKWSHYNSELLTRLFDNQSIAEEYKQGRKPYSAPGKLTPSQAAQNLWDDFDNCRAFMEAMLERLELIPEPVQANTPSASSAQQTPLSREVFIVHGHDEAAKEAVARVLSQLDLKPIILNEKADAGLTIIEKFEKHANVAFAVILLTPDDIGCAKKKPEQRKPRARQNVILEFGYFLGKLGRGKVCALYKEGVELPSDLYGILYVSMDASGAWKFRLAKELAQAGIKVDSNALLAD
jgi:predicted nucleotide-binding protein